MSCFKKYHTLTQAAKFNQLLKTKPFSKNALFRLHRLPNELIHPRIGYTIPKRFLKHASKRNLIKRIVKEFFRTQILTKILHELKEDQKNLTVFYDYLLVLKDFPSQHVHQTEKNKQNLEVKSHLQVNQLEKITKKQNHQTEIKQKPPKKNKKIINKNTLNPTDIPAFKKILWQNLFDLFN